MQMPTPLGEILHNIADHTETILHVLNEPNLAADVVQRMNDHILLEEKENSAKLEEIHRSNPTTLTQKLLDHSFFIQKMLSGPTMSLALKKELLDHFAEEHLEWREQLGPEAFSDTASAQGSSPASIYGSPSHSHGGSGGAHSHGGGGAHTHGGSQSHSHGGHSHSGSQSQSHGSGHSHGSSGGHQKSESQKPSSDTASDDKKWTVGPLWPRGE